MFGRLFYSRSITGKCKFKLYNVKYLALGNSCKLQTILPLHWGLTPGRVDRSKGRWGGRKEKV